MAHLKTAIFAAGCFWGVQAEYDRVPGVVKTTAGYTGGQTPHPTYEQVCSLETGHAESVQIEFDPNQVSYRELVALFFKLHDPTLIDRQGPNEGNNYRSAIFYTDDSQRETAEAVIAKLTEKHIFDKPIATEVTRATEFYPAEEYHQKYCEKQGYGPCSIWPRQS